LVLVVSSFIKQTPVTGNGDSHQVAEKLLVWLLTNNQPKDDLCQVWLKLSFWFWRRFLKKFSVFLLFCDYLPLEKGQSPLFEQFRIPSPKDDLNQVWLKLAQWFWTRSRKCKSFSRRTEGQRAIRITHFSFQLRWAKKAQQFTLSQFTPRWRSIWLGCPFYHWIRTDRLLNLGGRFHGEVVRGIRANGAFKTVRSATWEAQLLYLGHTTSRSWDPFDRLSTRSPRFLVGSLQHVGRQSPSRDHLLPQQRTNVGHGPGHKTISYDLSPDKYAVYSQKKEDRLPRKLG
jgi:hypothetical protein